jgi:hypothetical protein
VASLTLKDGPGDSASISKKNEAEISNSDKYGISSSISGSIISGSQQDYNVKEPVIETSRGVESNVPSQPKPSVKKPAARAKVPFEKGYSPMDWLKLTRTHPDLAGICKFCFFLDVWHSGLVNILMVSINCDPPSPYLGPVGDS